MQLRVKFFASLREQTGLSEVSINADDAATVLDVWNLSTGQLPMPENTLCAIDMAYARPEDAIGSAAEIAFFPPVTGGES